MDLLAEKIIGSLPGVIYIITEELHSNTYFKGIHHDRDLALEAFDNTITNAINVDYKDQLHEIGEITYNLYMFDIMDPILKKIDMQLYQLLMNQCKLIRQVMVNTSSEDTPPDSSDYEVITEILV
jgi:hypothetical protein